MSAPTQQSEEVGEFSGAKRIKQLNKRYRGDSVLDAARERVRLIFDRCEHVYVSVSGGKDSQVAYLLCRDEAESRGRKVRVFFLDQEAEYQGSVGIVREMMRHPAVEPLWYQVPIRLTNATSYTQDQLYAWGEGEAWMREKEPDSIHAIDEDYPQRFYPFFEWFEREQPAGSAHVVGLRAEEGINRFRAVTRNPGLPDIKWSSKTKRKGSHKFYPVYDWGCGDVWKFISDRGERYNPVYDALFALNRGTYNTLRVSNLIHEKSFSCLADLQLVEPDTYARLIERLRGVHCAAHHVRKGALYGARELPVAFSTWRAYRDFLLASLPVSEDKRERHAARFQGQGDEEHVCRSQVRRLLINDYEGSVPVTAKARAAQRDKFARWRKLF